MERPEFSSGHSVGRAEIRPRHRSQARSGRLLSAGAIVLLTTWAGSATLYILFNDEALKYLAERQVAIARSYETQAATLQAEIERLRSLKLIEQERVERAIADITRRQTAIETRQSALAGFGVESGRTVTGAPNITGSVSPTEPVPSSKPANRPTPLSDTILISPPSERWAQLQSRPLPPLNPRATDIEDARIAGLAAELRRIEGAQSQALNNIEIDLDGRNKRMRKVLDDLGVHPHRAVRSAAQATVRAATGGPFLPFSRAPEDPFARQAHRVRAAAETVKALEREVATIPVRRPLPGDAEVTSGFGVRLDPFLRRPAMHTGVDFRGDPGDPVHAAAGGRVLHAERDGGYGLMVEIDHGNGLTTRYAHLSATTVSVGATVEAGDVVGRVGSTGRSTGPHLHYEVRLFGETTDPQRFLRAGLRLHEPK